GEIARGVDPAAKRQAERAKNESTLRALIADDGEYAHHLKRRRIVAAKQVLSSLRRGLPSRLMGKDIADLTRGDLVTAIEAIEKHGRPGAATDLRKASRGLLEWAVSTGRAHHNVLAGLRRPKRSRAERLAAAANGGRALSDDEIRRVWQAAGDLGALGGLVR